jgi:choline dehydrogenase
VNREAIVCAGAFESPKLLMLSGIGPADALRALGLPVVCDIPEVGRNLQDHMLLGVGYECPVDLPAPALLAEAGLFAHTRPGMAAASPDLQYFFGPVKFVPQQYLTDGPGFTFAPILARPHSRGQVTLASADARDNARVDPNYLSNEVDLEVLEYGIRFARELVATAPFRGFRGREIAPGDQVTDRAGLRAYIRAAASTVWHACGTCRMGRDDASVVDPRLRVRGLDNLRVADASVMPRLVNGNPNAAIMMIGEKAADMISNADTLAAAPSVSAASPSLATAGRS